MSSENQPDGQNPNERSTIPVIYWTPDHPDGDNPDQLDPDYNYDQDMHGANGEFVEDSFESEDSDSDYDDPMRGSGELVEDTFGKNKKCTRTIPDGEHKIASIINENVVAQLNDDSSVHASQYFGLNNQKWNFTYDHDKKAYKITSSKNPDLALTSQEDIVVGHKFTGEHTQYWSVVNTGVWLIQKLRSLHDPSKVLDLAEGSTSNGSRIQLCKETDNPENIPNQKWKIKFFLYRWIEDGEYKIESSSNANVVAHFNDDSSVHASQYYGLNNQIWNFTYDHNKKAYKITSSKEPNLALTWCTEDESACGFKFTGGHTQYWRVERSDDIESYPELGYKLRSLHDPSKVLDLAEGETSNTKIVLHQEHLNNMAHQRWTISSICHRTVSDGDYKIASSINLNVVVDLSDGDDRPLRAWQYLGVNNQKWNFRYDNNKKAYKITSYKDPKIALTWCTEDGRVIGLDFSSQPTQYWRVERTKDGYGYYKIKSLHDPSKVLDLSEASTSNGNKIVLYQENPDNTPHQKWALQTINKALVGNGEHIIASIINRTKVIDFDSAKNNLMISDHMKLQPSYWRFEYDTTKNAYKIYKNEYPNLGLYFQSSNFDVKVDNIDNLDSSDLRPYWTIEYIVTRGGCLFRNLQDSTQVLDIKDSSITSGTSIISYSVNDNNSQLWY
ncbi:pierisin-like, partial [Contarinia nasturtii]|uniref:pierisin-like n=1 Tax=Contarinia nasturtii TaxID=265458 RepID=UPI0012D4A1EF